MLLLTVEPVAFTLGSLQVYWYGVVYALSVLVALAVMFGTLRRMRALGADVPDVRGFDNFLFLGIVSMVVGARLGHVCFFEPGYYLHHPLEILLIRNGGLAFHGGVLGLLFVVYMFRRSRGFHPRLIMDILSFAGAFALMIGRIANFINQELYGRITSVDWAVVFSLVDAFPRHPTQLYEAFFEGFINAWALMIVWALKSPKMMGSGIFCGIFCVIYSLSRFVIEFFKEEAPMTFLGSQTLTTGQFLSIALFLLGAYVLHSVFMSPRAKTKGDKEGSND